MFNHSHSGASHARRRHFSGNNFNRSNAGRHQRRAAKKLDPNLFIHQPKNEDFSVENQVEEKISFTDFSLDSKLVNCILQKKYSFATPIQAQAIPYILEGKDVIGIANTGTGKTAAFLVPLINQTLNNRFQKNLIITPTRELAIQIRDELISFTKGLPIHSVLTIGGTNIFRQKSDLRRNNNFVIGTPGRLKDLVNNRVLDLGNFNAVVLDEVDRMVDIGFIADIKYLISFLPKNRQSLFFSATVDGQVRQILNSFVSNPVTVSVKTGNTAKQISQDVIHISHSSQKIDVLHDLLIQESFERVIIFGRTKRGVEKLSHELNYRGFKAVSIHGNKSQGQRQRALRAFKDAHANILLATDVASRGIDVENVTHVINFDAPETYDDYVHRIGRTGRGNNKGVAITFVEK